MDTTSSSFLYTPVYVISLSSRQGFEYMWQLLGAANLYNPTHSSFQVFLDKVHDLHVAKAHRWRINYLGYAGEQIFRNASTEIIVDLLCLRWQVKRACARQGATRDTCQFQRI